MFVEYETRKFSIPLNVRKVISDRTLLEIFQEYLDMKNFDDRRLEIIYDIVLKYPYLHYIEKLIRLVDENMSAVSIELFGKVIGNNDLLFFFYENNVFQLQTHILHQIIECIDSDMKDEYVKMVSLYNSDAKISVMRTLVLNGIHEEVIQEVHKILSKKSPLNIHLYENLDSLIVLNNYNVDKDIIIKLVKYAKLFTVYQFKQVYLSYIFPLDNSEIDTLIEDIKYRKIKAQNIEKRRIELSTNKLSKYTNLDELQESHMFFITNAIKQGIPLEQVLKLCDKKEYELGKLRSVYQSILEEHRYRMFTISHE